MDVSPYRHADSIRINLPVSQVYAIVSDVTRMGELSPVCTSCTWDDASHTGGEGSWFTGHNAIGDLTWDTRCKVVAADPGRSFAFVNYGLDGTAGLARWGFDFESADGETTVTESWQVLPAYPSFIGTDSTDAEIAARIDGMAAREGIHETLANLKSVAEA